MWDLKLIFLDFVLNTYIISANLSFYLFNLLDPTLLQGLALFTLKNFYIFPQNLAFIFAVKFSLAIGFLILIRGGAPRYRYDYLTKLGWLKFLSLVILVFASSILFFFLF